MNRITISAQGRRTVPPEDSPATVPDAGREPGPLDAVEGHVLGRHVKAVFRCWILVFALVGAQMGWVLRPFIGAPGEPFQWFRPRESNFFEAITQTLIGLLTGNR